MKHGPISRTTDVEQLGLWHPWSHRWHRAAFSPKGSSLHNSRISSILCLRLWFVLLPSLLITYAHCRFVLSETDSFQHLIGTLDALADSTLESILTHFDFSRVSSIHECPSICNDSLPMHPTNFSHTLDPTQHATPNLSSSSQFHPSWLRSDSWIYLPSVSNGMSFHTPENRRWTFMGPNYRKIACKC